jgi:2-methylcitrate dehydratase PrpD
MLSAALSKECEEPLGQKDADQSKLIPALTAFVSTTRYADIPADVIAVGKGHLLDSLGCGLAGSISLAGKITRDYLTHGGGGAGESTMLGAKETMAPRFAAFANGLAMHADDFDDTGPQPSPERNGGIHATVPVFAATLALAEPQGRSGRDVMEAVHIGVEVSCKLNHAINPEHYTRGYHSTATIGMFGATAAAARVLGLDDSQFAYSLGIAASQSSGLRGNFGSMMNPFHAGHVAECGVVSAELARRGFTSSKTLLDDPKIGFFQATADGYDPDAVIGKLGQPWAFIDPGMWIKPFPCGALTHPALTALIDLAHAENINPDDVKAVSVQTNQHLVNTLIHNKPQSALQTKFSMPFAAAVALQRRRMSLGEFTEETVRDPALQALMAKVSFSAYTKKEPGYSNVTTLLTVEMTDGRIFSLRADYGKGNPLRPMTFDDLAEKFRGCADYARWNSSKSEDVIAIMRDFESLNDVRDLTRLVRTDG